MLKKLAVPIILLLLIGSLTALVTSLNLQVNINNLKFLGKQIATTSQVEISLDGQIVKIKFQISDYDRAGMNNFSQRLGLATNWQNGIEIKINQLATDYLKNKLPLRANISANENGLLLTVNNINSLTQPLLEDKNTTTASNLQIKQISDQNYVIEINNPKLLIEQAITNNKLNLSSQIASAQFWQVVSKLDKISLEIEGHNLTGRISLKN